MTTHLCSHSGDGWDTMLNQPETRLIALNNVECLDLAIAESRV